MPCMKTVYKNSSNPKPGHTTGGSGQGGARRGNRAARSWIGQDAVRSIRQEDNIRLALQQIVNNLLNVSSEARTVQFVLKTNGGTKSAVDQRLISRTKSALRSWLLTRLPASTCIVNPFFARHVREQKKAVHWSAARTKARFSSCR